MLCSRSSSRHAFREGSARLDSPLTLTHKKRAFARDLYVRLAVAVKREWERREGGRLLTRKRTWLTAHERYGMLDRPRGDVDGSIGQRRRKLSIESCRTRERMDDCSKRIENTQAAGMDMHKRKHQVCVSIVAMASSDNANEKNVDRESSWPACLTGPQAAPKRQTWLCFEKD